MKKIIPFIMIFAGMIFISCEPNEELYDELDKAEGAFSKSFEYKLLKGDYDIISSGALANAESRLDSLHANSIASTHAFSNDIIASYYIPSLIAEKFIAFKEGSEAEVTYHYIFDDSVKADKHIVIDDIFSSSNSADNYIEDQIEILDSLNEYLEDDFLVFDYQLKVGADTVDTSDLYVYYGGLWSKKPYYEVTEQDYDAMVGPDGSGPGEHGNFSESYPHWNYFPTLLGNLYPYAMNGDKYYIKYNYYEDDEYTMFTRYQYNDGWLNYSNKSEKFIHNGEEWVFSPIFKVTFANAEYKIVVDYIKNHPDLSDYMDPNYDNSEYYYGASYYYNNFDMRVSKRLDNDPQNLLEGLSDDEIIELMWERVYEAIDMVLEIEYPTAQPTVNGAQVYYQVTIQTWEPGDYFYIITYEVTDVGKFELFQEKVPL